MASEVTNGIPPAAAGPAGAEFEVKVGSSYLLAMLCDAPARGLPGAVIERISFQQGDDGFPMDDIVVAATHHSGASATLEIQAKRAITFAPRDPIFEKVMSQVAAAANQQGFWERRAELAVATPQTSRQISGPYQEVLAWARDTASPQLFFARLERRGTASEDMRSFVATFRAHLSTFGAVHDDLHVWRLLRRFQILVFDFSKTGGAEDYWAVERAKGLLKDEDCHLAGSLWSSVIKTGLETDASSGSRSRSELIEELMAGGFELEARRGVRAALRNLAEASGFAMDDISDSIQNVSLSRHARVEEVHAALSKGRYLEIRGSAGVGKSALLKRYVSQIANSKAVIFLSPNRIPSGGWQSFRHKIEFLGSAEELLVELSASGCSLLCIDNLDFFSEQEKATVKDLVRAARDVNGIQIVSTARLKLDQEEPNWLPEHILDDLGRAPVVTIEELTNDEVEELGEQNPKLAALIKDDHPAKLVARNLFRLSRLALLQSEKSHLHSEVDLAKQWWSTGDGASDANRRDRQRLLRAMAQHHIASNEFFSSREYSSQVIQQLIDSETLRDHGNDLVSFKHDVLREWAVASLFSIDAVALASLDMRRPGSPYLLRSLQLQSQMMIEAGNHLEWVSRLDRLSQSDVHRSWYRTAILAIIRSERSPQLLADSTPQLLADDCKIGRQLVSLAIASESTPIEELFPGIGQNLTTIPNGIIAPKNSSWGHLIAWLLQLNTIPTALIPAATDLMRAWMIGLIGFAPFSTQILSHFYNWLTEIESAKYPSSYLKYKEPFEGALAPDQLRNLEENLRTYFCIFADKTPDLARKYLNNVTARGKPDHIVTEILKMSGTLAKAAPNELSELTRNALIVARSSGKRRREEYDQGLSYLDSQFMPESPAQGPFYALLVHSLDVGLKLVHDLVNHIVDFQVDEWNIDDNPIIVPFDRGNRAFRYPQSFHWSRHSQCHSVTSALMALEAWGHKRVENGDSPLQVALKILEPENTPVAVLTVAIDVLLSSETTTYADMVPFLASPELVAMDRTRPSIQDPDDFDFFGLSSLRKEPAGQVSKADLKQKRSRKTCLEQLIPAYRNGKELRETLDQKLQAACVRLGQPEVGDNFADPRLMALYLRAQLDPKNYEEIEIKSSQSEPVKAIRFKAPPNLARIIDPLDAKREVLVQNMEKSNTEMAASHAVEDSSKGSPDLAARAAELAYANGSDDKQALDFIAAAAVLVLRDGDANLVSKYGAWAVDKLRSFGTQKGDYHDGAFSFLRYNRAALALTGLGHALKSPLDEEQIRPILATVANHARAITPGLRNSVERFNLANPKLIKSIVRIAVASCIFPWRNWQDEAEYEARHTRSLARIATAIDIEIDWILHGSSEPNWSNLPPALPNIRHGIRIGKAKSVDKRSEAKERGANPDDLIFDDGSVARIIAATKSAEQPDSFLEILNFFWPFTKVKNGADLAEARVDPPLEWNEFYYSLLADVAARMIETEAHSLLEERLIALPDEGFLGAASSFLQRLDDMTFGQKTISVEKAVQFREVVGRRMMMTYSWRLLKGDTSGSMSTEFRPAIASLFFNSAFAFQPATSCLLEPGIRRLDPAIPLLMKFISSAASYAVAVFVMNLVEVVFMPSHKQMVLLLAESCLANKIVEREFWIERRMGARICAYFQAFLGELEKIDDIEHLRHELDNTLNRLILIGVPEAQRLHDTLNS